jgi:pSer/pThr/pTyr-binding forkhead associated (FHA) protein
MAKLVILNQGLTGRTYDLKVGRNTVGRVDDNSFEIPDASVSSHHGEVHLNSEDAKEILFRDLGSTNGSFVNGEKVTETILKSGQVIRLGQVEMKFDDGSAPVSGTPSAPLPSAVPVPAPAPAAPAKKTVEGTMVIPRGVTMEQLEQGGTKAPGFDMNTSFTKRKDKTNKIFLIVGIVAFVVIVALIIYALMLTGEHK